MMSSMIFPQALIGLKIAKEEIIATFFAIPSLAQKYKKIKSFGSIEIETS
jgi:hypothetical protein